MIEEVKRFVNANGMLPEGTKVLCACSGGADSVCLLHLLRSWKGISVTCAHYNHSLRGAESDRDEQFVRDLCNTLDVPCVVGRGDAAAYAAEQGVGIEEAARELRYAFLEQTAAEQGCDRIATAHNAGDNAETVLMNLARGSGLKGLCGIPPVRDNVVRPLLTVTREEIEHYLEVHGIVHIEDSSNASDDYARNRVRHHVLPLLQEQNSAAIANITAATELLREDEEYLSAQADTFIKETCGQNGTVSVAALLALPKPVQARVLLRLCPGAKRIHVDALTQLCQSPEVHGEVHLPGLRVVREFDTLQIDPSKELPIPRQEILPGDTLLETAGWHIYCRSDVLSREIYNSFNTFCFKSERICGKIYVASRGDGDSVRLLGRGCTKTLKKLYAEARLPISLRTRIPVLYDDAGVIAVYGFGIAERCAAAAGDPVLYVEITDKRNREDKYYGK